jgi:hypothetical protein
MRATIGRPATGSTAEGVNGTRRQLIGPSKSETYRKRPGPDDPLVTPRSGWSTGTRRKPPPPCGAAILPYRGGGRFCEFPIGGAHGGHVRLAPPGGADRATPMTSRWALHGRRSLCHAAAPRGWPPFSATRDLRAGAAKDAPGGATHHQFKSARMSEHRWSAFVYDLSRHKPKFIE